MRIERLWVEVTVQVGSTWADHFSRLELHRGLDINNLQPLTKDQMMARLD